MPRALSMAIRQSIISRYKKGEKVASLSRELDINRGTLSSWIEKERILGKEGLRTNYKSCGRKRPNANDFIFRAVRCMRMWHPDWGAEKIRAEILLRRPKVNLPSSRTINRWFKWNNQVADSLKTNLPVSEEKKAKAVHEVWQIDAKEEMVLLDGSKNCWLNITDEHSGMVIQPPVFSQEKD